MTAHVTHYLCIGCPLGCRLEVEENKVGEVVEVRGFSCKRGEDYALQEHSDPRRMVSTTIAVDGHIKRLPVRTKESIRKQNVIDLCKHLRNLHLIAPIKMGDIVYTGMIGKDAEAVTIIATRDIYDTNYALDKD